MNHHIPSPSHFCCRRRKTQLSRPTGWIRHHHHPHPATNNTEKMIFVCKVRKKIEVPFFTFCLQWFFFELKTEAPAAPGVIPHPSYKKWQRCRCCTVANNRNDRWPWQKGEKKMNVTFFTSIFQLNTYALTVHGWYVSTLTKWGTADAAVPMKKLKRWRKHKVRKNISPISALLWNNFFNWMLSHRCHGW